MGELDARKTMVTDGRSALAGGGGPEQARVEPGAAALLGRGVAERGGDGESGASPVRVGADRRGGGIDRCRRSQEAAAELGSRCLLLAQVEGHDLFARQ